MNYIRHILFSFLVVLAVPVFVQAAQFRQGDQVRISEDESLIGNTYIGGGDVRVESTVTGDLFVAGGTVRVDGPVTGDLFVAGGDIRLTGPVTGDLRVAGGNVLVNSKVEGELLIMGGSAEILRGSQVGEVTVGAGQLTIAGETGPILAGAGQLTIEESAHVRGDIRYTSEKEATIADGATIEGDIVRELKQFTYSQPPHKAAWIGGGLLWFLSALLMLWLFIWVMPNKALVLSRQWRQQFPLGLLWGVLFLIVTPIVIVMLLVSIVGIPLAIGLLLFYPVILYLGKLVATVGVGLWLRSVWMKEEKVDWITIVLGLLLMAVIGVIPVLGWLVTLVLLVAGAGTLVRHDWALYKRLRELKEF